MIEIQFREPNFRAKVRENIREESRPYQRLLYADDVASGKNYLESRGLEVLDIKPYNFSLWLIKAKRAQTEANSSYPAARGIGKTYEFNSGIWGELKEHLQDIFHGNCAYCEAAFLAVSFGDVEHFRPKAAVSEDPNHPGYYWLAYSPTNYLPACSRCNTDAKRNSFPVKSGTRATAPTAPIDSEEPLLINRYRDRTCDHLWYHSWSGSGVGNPVENMLSKQVLVGLAIERSPKGKESKDVYKLNRKLLKDDRALAQLNALRRVKAAFTAADSDDLKQFAIDCIKGRIPFSTAVATEIHDYLRKMEMDPTRLFPSELRLGK